LTSSPYTVNEYGFCSQSVLTEWAPTGGRDHVKSYDIKSRERLKIARDLARGLADLQSLRHLHSYSDINRTSVFAHNDINIANTVFVNGMVKWNDFNIGVLLRTEIHNSAKACGSPVLFKADMWRSPEEVRNTSYVQVEQSDVYGLGNVLYQVMTRHQPWYVDICA
jgi:serine/threonine protein kinase